MGNYKLQVACVAFLFLWCFNFASANTQCFQCVEDRGRDHICRDKDQTKHASVSCPYSCITHTLAPITVAGVTSGEIVARVCSDPGYCKIGTHLLETELGFKTRDCKSCDTDYCNSASATIPSFILVGVLALKYYFL